MATQPVYQFSAELEGYKPKIWRRFLVAGDTSVARLGYIVMTLYEMKASHLFAVEHECPFRTPGGKPSKRMELIGRYGIPSDECCPELDVEELDATKTELSQLDLSAPSRLLVCYDFGDGWRVLVTLEKTVDGFDVSGKTLPCVLEGKGLGIIEDCGGIWGLADIAKAFNSKKGTAYKRYCDWLGIDDLDMAAFDIDDMNVRLKKIPDIYAKIYEQQRYPTQASINLIERKYSKK